MKPTSSAGRFCSCSDFPPHLRIGSSGAPNYPTLSVDVEAASTGEARGPQDPGGSAPKRFCTCSEVPARLVEKAVVEPAVRDEAKEQNGAAGEARATVASATPDALASDADDDINVSGPTDAELELRSVSDLLSGESAVDSVSTHGKGASEVVLTNRRVLLRGAPEAKVLHASMPLAEIDSLAISRARPRKRSLSWGLIGIVAAIGMWQALDGVGNMRLIVVAVVIFMSGLLLVDYFLRPPDLQVVFRSRSGAEMIVEFAQSHAEDADRFAAQVLAKLESSKTR